MVEENKAKDFETYLISALNDSLLKKSKYLVQFNLISF